MALIKNRINHSYYNDKWDRQATRFMRRTFVKKRFWNAIIFKHTCRQLKVDAYTLHQLHIDYPE